MRTLGLAALFVGYFVSSAMALAERATRAQVGARVAGTSTTVLMVVEEVSPGVFEARQVRVNSNNELLVDASSAPVTIADGTVTVIQGAPGVLTTPWFGTLSRRSDGVELGLPASPFAGQLFDGAGAAFGTLTNPWIIGGEDGFGVAKTIMTDPGGRIVVVFGVQIGDGTPAAAGMRTDTGTNVMLQTAPALFDGVNWNRWRGTIADGALVDLGPNNDVQAVAHTGGLSDVGGALVTQEYVPLNMNTTDPVTLKAAEVGKRIRVLNHSYTAFGAVDVVFLSDAATIAGPFNEAAGTGPPWSEATLGTFQTEVNEALVIDSSAAVQIGGGFVLGLVD